MALEVLWIADTILGVTFGLLFAALFQHLAGNKLLKSLPYTS